MNPSIVCPVFHAARTSPETTALVCGDQVVSYAGFEKIIRSAQDKLRRHGLKRNDRIAVLSTNSLLYAAVLPAAWREGYVVCLLNPRFPQKTVASILQRAQCKLLLTSTDLEAIGTDTGSLLDLPEEPRIALEQPVTVILTSGSSAEPKMALHTFGNHYFNALGANQNMPLAPRDRWLLSLPLYHVGGTGIFFRALLAGAGIVIPDVNESLSVALARYEITHLSVVPTQLYRLIRNEDMISRLARLRAILLGGAPVPDNLLNQAVRSRLPIYITYGLTEMTSQVATGTPQNPRQAKILPYRQIMISADGEILVKSETLFSGYLESGGLDRTLVDGGWFATGDLGDLDGTGVVKIQGRKDSMFISGGENIQPEEIEKVLQGFDGIEQAVVVPRKDEEFGIRPVAFIRRRGRDSEDFSVADIRAFLRQYLPGFKVPVCFYPWPEELAHEKMKVRRRSVSDYLKDNEGRLTPLL
jgi:O-succinylbenzoic acid--CoA ligase